MNRNNLVSIVIILIIFLSLPVIPVVAYANDIDLEELLALDLEELTVSVASKRNETIQEAPGIISVITAEEIRQYGARNLPDILQRQCL